MIMSNLWHENLTYEQVEAEAEKDYTKVVYNLHEDCLCLREELEALRAGISEVMDNAYDTGQMNGGTCVIACDLDDLQEMLNKIAAG